MEKKAYIPDRWHVGKPHNDRGDIEIEGESPAATYLVAVAKETYGSTAKATAPMIAAAPDMLKALEAVTSNDDRRQCPFCLKNEWGADLHEDYCPMALAYAAIAKAKGEPT